jgi:uncharacterized protein YecE (DUF72 family)
MNAKIHIGTQGWIYEDWMGTFYPPKSSKKDLLRLYSKIFDTVEVDSTFYAIPDEKTILGWNAKTPENFTFSLKLPSEITHKNRLRDCEKQLSAFINRMLLLKQKLGCILIQLPPDFSPSEQKSLNEFLKLLPLNINFAIEFRDSKWLGKTLIEDLEGYGVAMALADSRWLPRNQLIKLIDYQTLNYAYLRWQGPRELSKFSAIQIDRTVEFKQWSEAFKVLGVNTETIFAYFNNHYQGHSPSSCNLFKELLGLVVTSPSTLITQPLLF